MVLSPFFVHRGVFFHLYYMVHPSQTIYHVVIFQMNPWFYSPANQTIVSLLHGQPIISSVPIKTYTMVPPIFDSNHKHIRQNGYRVSTTSVHDHVAIPQMSTWSYRFSIVTPNISSTIRNSSKTLLTSGFHLAKIDYKCKDGDSSLSSIFREQPVGERL